MSSVQCSERLKAVLTGPLLKQTLLGQSSRVDHLFDPGFIGFEDNGTLVISPVALVNLSALEGSRETPHLYGGDE